MDDRTLASFLWNLDVNEIALDPSDHYFSLMLSSYNTNGATLKERIKLKKTLDKTLGHTIPNFKKAD